jgi:hypothetical protein
VNFDVAVAFHQAQRPELVHEVTDPRARRADDLGERLLTDLCRDRLRAAFFAEVSQQEKRPRQPLFARVEELERPPDYTASVRRLSLLSGLKVRARLIGGGNNVSTFFTRSLVNAPTHCPASPVSYSVHVANSFLATLLASASSSKASRTNPVSGISA